MIRPGGCGLVSARRKSRRRSETAALFHRADLIFQKLPDRLELDQLTGRQGLRQRAQTRDDGAQEAHVVGFLAFERLEELGDQTQQRIHPGGERAGGPKTGCNGEQRFGGGEEAAEGPRAVAFDIVLGQDAREEFAFVAFLRKTRAAGGPGRDARYWRPRRGRPGVVLCCASMPQRMAVASIQWRMSERSSSVSRKRRRNVG